MHVSPAEVVERNGPCDEPKEKDEHLRQKHALDVPGKWSSLCPVVPANDLRHSSH